MGNDQPASLPITNLDEARALLGGGSDEAVERAARRLLRSAQRVEQLERELATERGLHQHTATLHERAVAELGALERGREGREAEQREQLRLIEADIALAAQRADEERARLTAERDMWLVSSREHATQRDMWLASSREHATQRDHATRHMTEARRERDEARDALRRLHRDMGRDDRERRQALDDSAALIARWASEGT